jgi:hypothetical protein
MVWMTAAEAILRVLAHVMIRMAIAKAPQNYQFEAQLMTGIPATETISMSQLKQGFNIAPPFVRKQRPGCHGGRRPSPGGSVRRRGRDRGRGENDAPCQQVLHRPKRSHGSPLG